MRPGKCEALSPYYIRIRISTSNVPHNDNIIARAEFRVEEFSFIAQLSDVLLVYLRIPQASLL